LASVVETELFDQKEGYFAVFRRLVRAQVVAGAVKAQGDEQ
jgi:hypothetical protein